MSVLAGIRVADFSWVGAGPFLTKPLADHGADVIKIESRTRTDVIRTMPPFRDGIPGVNRSGYFADRNTSKRSICLDLSQPEAREIALKLMAVSDVAVNNFTPGTMDRLGLGYEAAREVKRDIVYLEMPMQGATGPYRSSRGYGLSIAAASGFFGLSGEPDRPPVGTGTNYPDHVPNPLHGAVAVLAALRRRRATGEGCYIEVSQLESTANIIGPELVAAAAGHHVQRRGNDDPQAAPHGVYPSRGQDRWIAIAVTDDVQWQKLIAVLGHPDWAVDPAFARRGARLASRREIDDHLRDTTSEWEADKLADALCEAGVPASPVQTAADLFDDPQLVARRQFVTLDHPVMGPSIYSGIPYRLSRTPGALRSPAPLLGADTRAVCTELLGMSEPEYQRLAETGAVG